jgi:excinuclease ABC subunit C
VVSRLIEEQLSRLPERPGVYLMRDAAGIILYVGKASNLKNRVRSYFGNKSTLSGKTQQLAAHIADIDYFVSSSEQEALILEATLIKQYHPHYNIRLKDDKSFPYLKIDMGEAWPRIYITRRMEQDGSRYFGPFTDVASVRQTLRVLHNIFPLRICSKDIKRKASRACLEYHMGRCLAPCIGAVSRKEYDQLIKEVTLFLEGKQERVVWDLRARMNKAAAEFKYESAALFRDQIQAIQQVIEGQRTAATIKGEQDAIAFAQDRDQAYVQVFYVRNSRLTGREGFLLQGTRLETPQQIMSSFIKQYYSSSPTIPPLLLLQYPVEDAQNIEAWLHSQRGGDVKIQVPRRGNRKQFMDVVAENARQGLERLKIKELVAPRSLDAALAEIKEALGLGVLPVRMEAYDISNIQGKSAVGSMVVFEQGKPKPAHYRCFKIKTVSGANDYAMMQEVLRRRFQYRRSTGDNDTWAIMPDLVLIDGGKGQLNAALEVFRDLQLSLPIAGLAKENEEVFLPGKQDPILLPKSSSGLQLLQRLRDEAHRFAITYYTNVHRKEAFVSALDSVPGIGPRRKRALIRHFGSVPKIKEASVDELVAATGMSQLQAKKIKEYL